MEPIRIPAHLIPINAPPAEDCTLEAMRTQACANQCMDFKGLLFAQPSLYMKALAAGFGATAPKPHLNQWRTRPIFLPYIFLLKISPTEKCSTEKF